MFICLTYASSQDTSTQDGDWSTVVVFGNFPGGAHDCRRFNFLLCWAFKMLLVIDAQDCGSIVLAEVAEGCLLFTVSLVTPGGPPRSRHYMLAPGGRSQHARCMTSFGLVKPAWAFEVEAVTARDVCEKRGAGIDRKVRTGAILFREQTASGSLIRSEKPACPPGPQAEMPRPRPVPRHKVGLAAPNRPKLRHSSHRTH